MSKLQNHLGMVWACRSAACTVLGAYAACNSIHMPDPSYLHILGFTSLLTLAMSTAAKLTLASTIAGTVGIVAFVHWAQTAEKAVRSLFYFYGSKLTGFRQCMLA